MLYIFLYMEAATAVAMAAASVAIALASDGHFSQHKLIGGDCQMLSQLKMNCLLHEYIEHYIIYWITSKLALVCLSNKVEPYQIDDRQKQWSNEPTLFMLFIFRFACLLWVQISWEMNSIESLNIEGSGAGTFKSIRLIRWITASMLSILYCYKISWSYDDILSTKMVFDAAYMQWYALLPIAYCYFIKFGYVLFLWWCQRFWF